MRTRDEAQELKKHDSTLFTKIKKDLVSFKKFIVLHETLREAADKVLSILDTALEPSLIFVIGPTTVGKTTVRSYIEKTITEEALPTLSADQLPLLSIELPAVTPKNPFDWRDVYAQCLIALGDPLLDKKMNYPAGGIKRGPDGNVTATTGTTTSALSHALRTALRLRRPAAVLLDEAHVLTHVKNGDDLLLNVELLKSLANTTRIPIILFGTYDVQPLLRLNGQLSRRSEVIHMPRYHCDRSDDRMNFHSTIRAFQRRLPLREEPDLLSHHEFLYEHSLGCVGLLKDWLCRALWKALVAQSSTIDEDTLKATATPAWKCLDILKECDRGEAALEEKPSDIASLKEALKAFEPKRTSPSPFAKKRGNSAPFQRNASRDKIGQQRDDS